LPIADSLVEVIQERGPITVAAFMEHALYHPRFGYYARAARRSGRAGDFFTSVDVGPLFGELLEIQLAEMHAILAGVSPQLSGLGAEPRRPKPDGRFDLIEAAAGNGRLSTDILRAARRRDPAFYNAVRLHLVEVSPEARRGQTEALGEVRDRLASSSPDLPDSFEGALVANELLDAMPVHQVVMRADGLREVYVDVARPMQHRDRDAEGPARPLVIVEGPPSTPELQGYLDRLDVTLEPGWRGEINLDAIAWVRDAARRLRRGFIILIDYGHHARHLYSTSHAGGTLTTYARHHSDGPESVSATPPWLMQPGERDITSHIDFTSVRAAAEHEGLTTLGFLDQTYFVLGLLEHWEEGSRPPSLALKTLMMPGGLGSTHKVLILGKDVGAPALQGCSFRMRVT
jgi:SAM-dependent MidA family methyltransferase